jgi:cytochrome c-type biogenesis protein
VKMHLADYSLALISGVFVLLSPCSYPLFPGYIAYYLGKKITTRQAIQGGIICTIGLLSVFSIIGIITSTVGSVIMSASPYLHLLAVFIIGGMGVVMLLGVGYPKFYLNVKATQRGGFLGMYIYGATYGLAALACSFPIFLSLIFYSITFGEFLDSILTFILFSLGMGIPLIATAVLVSKTGHLLVRRITGATDKIQRISGIFLIILAIYLYLMASP